MPAYHLRTFYLGKQSAWDSSATATARLEGVTDGNVTVNIQDEVIETIGWNVGNITKQQLRESEISLSLVATYEQILYILHGLFGPVTPTGSQSPYTWTYKVPRANTVIPQFYTVRYGIEPYIYKLNNCFVSEVSLKGEVKNALELEVTMLCPYSPEVSVVGTIPVTNVNAIHVREAEFYLSNVTTNPFSTSPVEATLKSFEININPNRHIKRFIGNDSFFGDGRWEITGSLVVEFNTTSKAIIDDVLNNLTVRNLGLRFISSADTNKQVSIIMPFIINDSFELFSDADGNATVELSVEAKYNQLFDTALQIEVLTDTNTLP